MIGVKNLDSVHKRIKKLNLFAEYKREVENFFADFHFLLIPKAEEIFEKYFNSAPPFSESGKKKSEFPDAFIIQSVLNYVYKYDKNILVVSSDDDWKKAFCNIYGVTFVASINDAIKYIQKLYTSSEIAERYINLSLDETFTILRKKLENSTFYVDDFYSEVENIDVVSMSAPLDICPLFISNHKIIYSAIAQIEIIANIRVLDESKSLWNSEEKSYIDTEYKQITVTSNINVYYEAEVSINDDRSVTCGGAVVLNNVNNNRDIQIDLSYEYR